MSVACMHRQHRDATPTLQVGHVLPLLCSSFCSMHVVWKRCPHSSATQLLSSEQSMQIGQDA